MLGTLDGRNKSGHDDFWFRSKRNNRLPFLGQPCGFSGMTNNLWALQEFILS
jgi:hypothetical protein